MAVREGKATPNGWADRIQSFDLTRESVLQEISKPARRTRGTGPFRTILKNRTFHGGHTGQGIGGLLKLGENGKGIKSRWYPETLARRLVNLQQVAG